MKYIIITLFFLIVSMPAQAASNIPVPANGLYFGAWVSGPNGETGNGIVSDFVTLINKDLAIMSGVWTDVVNYHDPNNPGWNQQALENMSTVFHAVPLITLNTYNRTLSEIVTNTIHPNDKRPNNGTLPDEFFRGWARGLKEYGKPVFLRFNHEMNGNWYPWGICTLPGECLDPDTGVQQTPELYITAWRHVHDIFRAEEVTNVTWVWCPSFIHDTNIWISRFDNLYPGDEYVDWTALDVYNADTWPWRSFAQLVQNDYATLLRVAPGKPVMIAEFNSGFGGDPTGAKKAGWIQDAFRDLPPLFPAVKAVMWFNIGPVDPLFGSFRIEDSQETTTAFRQAVAPVYFLPRIAIPGDADGNQLVDHRDFSAWATNYARITDTAANGNFNGDTAVDGRDYTIWAINYTPR